MTDTFTHAVPRDPARTLDGRIAKPGDAVYVPSDHVLRVAWVVGDGDHEGTILIMFSESHRTRPIHVGRLIHADALNNADFLTPATRPTVRWSPMHLSRA